MKGLSFGVQVLSQLRMQDWLHVGKTHRPLDLMRNSGRHVPARPRRMHAGVSEDGHAEGMPSVGALACVRWIGTACANGVA